MSYLDDPRVLFAAERTALSPSQRGFSLWVGVLLLLMGGAVAVLSALQFRSVVRGLGAKEIPRGYWTQLGVWLNFLLAFVALALAVHFVLSE
jgi:putative membrane protein